LIIAKSSVFFTLVLPQVRSSNTDTNLYGHIAEKFGNALFI
jgi:hypothetical protein